MYESGLIREISFDPWVYWKMVVSLAEQFSHRLLGLSIAIRPERLHRIEGGADTLGIGIPVLHHDAFDRVLMPGGNAIAHGCAVVLHVDAEFLQTEDAKEQFLDTSGEIVEGVIELIRIRRIAVAEARVVRRNHDEICRPAGG